MLLDASSWEKLSPLLDEALELDPTALDGWLADLESSEPALAGQLRTLLRHEAAALKSGFLNQSAFDDPRDVLVGQRFGAYTLIAPLGEGGMGVVWLAERSDGRFDGRAAIKLLHAGLVRPAVSERFRREGAILARLSHPHIARLFDAGLADNGQPYLVLEYVAGQPIDQWCDQRHVSVRERLRLFLQVLDAVAHAHARLVIHRDIKPSNVLVDDLGSAKLLDFGVAKLIDTEDSGDPTMLTREGGPGLTPFYAAPEQHAGGVVTTGTDVYALGLLLYFLLTGQHPRQNAEGRLNPDATFPNASYVVTDLARRAHGALQTAAESRNTTPARLAGLLAGDIDNILAKALKSDPSERYGTVDAFADDLRRHLDGQTVSARPDTLGYRLGRFVKRHRGGVAAGLLIVVAILVGIAGTWTQARRAEQQAEIAQRERDRAESKLAQATAVEEFLSFLLSSQADKSFTTSDLLRRGEVMVYEQFADAPGLRARLLAILSSLTDEMDEQDRTAALLKGAREAAASTTDGALIAAIDCALAANFVATPDAAQAAKLFEAAIARVGAGSDADRGELAACLNQRAMRASETGEPKQAAEDFKAALAAMEPLRSGSRTLVLAIRMGLAGVEAKMGHLSSAVENLRTALVELESIGHGRTTGAATFHNNLGVLLYRAGDLEGAMAEYRKILAIQGGSDALSSPNLKNIAVALLDLGMTRDANAYFERSQALATARGDTRTAAYGISAFPQCPAPPTECARRLAAAKATLASFLPPDHQVFADLEFTRARMALARDQRLEASTALHRALDIAERATGSSLVQTRARTLLARVAISINQMDEARAQAAAAVSEARGIAEGFKHSFWLGEALLAHSVVLLADGDVEKAESTMREALVHLDGSGGSQTPAAQEVRRLLAAVSTKRPS